MSRLERSRCVTQRKKLARHDDHPLLQCLNLLTKMLLSATPPGTGSLHPPPEWHSAPELRPTFPAIVNVKSPSLDFKFKRILITPPAARWH
jgi:hypothetical protein